MTVTIPSDSDRRAAAFCPGCGGFDECFAGCTYENVRCTCDTRLGCHRHGPQPRETAVLCARCRKPTWAADGVCTLCHDKGHR